MSPRVGDKGIVTLKLEDTKIVRTGFRESLLVPKNSSSPAFVSARKIGEKKNDLRIIIFDQEYFAIQMDSWQEANNLLPSQAVLRYPIIHEILYA